MPHDEEKVELPPSKAHADYMTADVYWRARAFEREEQLRTALGEVERLKQLAQVAHQHLRTAGWPIQNTAQYNALATSAIPDLSPVNVDKGYFSQLQAELTQLKQRETAESAWKRGYDAGTLAAHDWLVDEEEGSREQEVVEAIRKAIIRMKAPPYTLPNTESER